MTLAEKHHTQQNNKYALASIRYLWNVLDLSTTDNIALHIGNYLCECEKHYFQSLLQIDKKNRHKRNKSPYQITFFAHSIIIDCLTPLIDEPHKLAKASLDTSIKFEDSQFKVEIENDIEILGNRNHLRLLFENLINNIQFYHKKGYHRKTDNKKVTSNKKLPKPIIIKLLNSNDRIFLQLYNYGQKIPDDKKETIFQLGYSSRLKKENHGKGAPRSS
ncbi:MAG: signal transduction histidine kinase [Cellvibrionaceae bacterium]